MYARTRSGFLGERNRVRHTPICGAIRYNMKRNLNKLSRRYAAALRKQVKQNSRANLEPARGLGREAVNLGLETPDVAKIHAAALANMEGLSGRDGIVQRAEIFYAEAITPFENTHQAALKDQTRLLQVNKTLDQRTLDLEDSNRSLKQSIARQKSAEEALKKGGRNAKKLLGQSHRLQQRLQHLTHQIISAHEEKRWEISHDLQNEIVQTLVGINVRLISLKQEAAGDAKGLEKSIVAAQRLLEESVEFIDRFARELAVPQSG
jgi:signal transduction histidine kinase